MKIAHVFVDFPNESQLYNSKLISRLELSGVKCAIITFTNRKQANEFETYSVAHQRFNWFLYLLRGLIRYKTFRKYKRSTSFNFKKAIFYFGRFSVLIDINPNVVHIHHIQLLQPSLLNFLSVCNIKAIVSFRGGDLLVRPKRSKKETNFVIKVVESIKNVHLVSNHLKINLKVLNPIGINYFVIRRSVETDSIVKLNKVENDRPMILTIGRLHWTKGYKIALEAIYLLKSSGVSFSYHICGSYTNDQKDELNYWIAKYNLQGTVVFHGHLKSEEIDELLSLTTVYLQSSLSEGIPNTLLRALKHRVPTVTTNAGGIPEIFQNNVDGLLAEMANPQDLFLKLNELLLNTKMQESIRKSKNVLISNYDKEIDRYKKMYQTVYTN